MGRVTGGRGARRARGAVAVGLATAVLAGCDLGEDVVRLRPSPGRAVFDVLAVDVDGDDDTDLVAKVDYGLAVLTNDGTGGFTATSTETSVRYYIELVAGDLTGDGYPDLLGLLYGGQLEYRAGTGSGTFSTTRRPLPTGGPVGSGVALGDLDGDGDTDVLASIGNGVAVWANDGAGRFAAPYVLDDSGADKVAVGDLDGDGDLDVVTSSASDGGLAVSRGDGTGDFAAPVTYGVMPSGRGSLALADVDADGDLDAVTGRPDDADIATSLNDGTGAFGTAIVSDRALAQPRGTTELATADIDGDGVLDVVTAGPTSSVLFGDGTGRFVEPHDVLGNEQLAVGDLDGDGRDDLVYASTRSEWLRYLRNAMEGRTHG